MELSKWFEYQLQSTLDGFIWAVHQLPKERLYTLPPKQLGEWSAAQHVYHMLEYEEDFALPSMSQWLGVPRVIPEESVHGFTKNQLDVEERLARFERVRRAEIDMISKFDHDSWGTVMRTNFWGDVSLYWLVCKTYQHTVEHTHNILSLTLFWDGDSIRHASH